MICWPLPVNFFARSPRARALIAAFVAMALATSIPSSPKNLRRPTKPSKAKSRFNDHRLLSSIGFIPPTEAEVNYYRQLAGKNETEV